MAQVIFAGFSPRELGFDMGPVHVIRAVDCV
jgi:hypothetical protein